MHGLFMDEIDCLVVKGHDLNRAFIDTVTEFCNSKRLANAAFKRNMALVPAIKFDRREIRAVVMSIVMLTSA